MKLALFDIDGVIYEGHSIFHLIQEQEKTGFIKKGLWDQILKLLEKYRKGEMSYKDAADSMLLAHSKSLSGMSYKDLIDENLKFIHKYSNKIFPYFTKLVEKLEKTHDIYLVTTNFDPTAEAFTKHFGLKGFLSSKIKKENGIALEGVELSLGGNKGVVSDLIKSYGKLGSIAIGDSENDADMLDLVEYPLVFEPNHKLKKIAEEKGWQTVNRDTITDIMMTHVRN